MQTITDPGLCVAIRTANVAASSRRGSRLREIRWFLTGLPGVRFAGGDLHQRAWMGMHAFSRGPVKFGAGTNAGGGT